MDGLEYSELDGSLDACTSSTVPRRLGADVMIDGASSAGRFLEFSFFGSSDANFNGQNKIRNL